MNVFHLNRSRFRRLPGCAAIVAAFWLGIAEIETAVPASNREQVAPTSDKPWAPPNLPAYENALRKDSAKALEKGKELVDVRKEYTLADLIDLAVMLHRDDIHQWNPTRPGEADIEITKHRYGPNARTTLAFQGRFSRFVDMAS